MLEFTPTRSSKALLRVFKAIVDMNQSLSASGFDADNPNAQMNHAFHVLARLCKHDTLIVFISDFFGFDERCLIHVKNLALRNNLILAQVVDPLDKQISLNESVVVGNAEHQADVVFTESVKKKYKGLWVQQQALIEKSTRHSNVNHIQLNASMDLIPQLAASLYSGPGVRSEVEKDRDA